MWDAWQVSDADRLSPRCSLSRCGCVSLAGCARRDGDGAPSPRPWPPSGAPDSQNASHRLRGSPAQAPGRPPLFCPALAKARYPSPRHRSRAAPPERRSPQTLAAALARRFCVTCPPARSCPTHDSTQSFAASRDRSPSRSARSRAGPAATTTTTSTRRTGTFTVRHMRMTREVMKGTTNMSAARNGCVTTTAAARLPPQQRPQQRPPPPRHGHPVATTDRGDRTARSGRRAAGRAGEAAHAHDRSRATRPPSPSPAASGAARCSCTAAFAHTPLPPRSLPQAVEDLARRSLQVTARCLGRSRLMTAVGRVSGAAPPGSSGRPVAKNPMCRCCRPRDAAKEQLGRGAVPQRRQCAVREVHAAGQGVGVGRRCRVVSRRAGPGKWSASPRRSQRPSTSRQR